MFSIAKDNPSLWKRYGGCGNGLCIELEIPDNSQGIFNVNYVKEKAFHIDSFLESALLESKAFKAYQNMLLTKSIYWEPEEEVRIVTKKQDVLMQIEGSVTEIMFGNKVDKKIEDEIQSTVNDHFSKQNHRRQPGYSFSSIIFPSCLGVS